MNTFTQTIYPGRLTSTCDSPDLFVKVFGEFTSTGDFQWEQISPNITVHVIVSGSGIMNANNFPRRIETGDLFMFWKGDHVRYWDYPDTPWRYYWFSLGGGKAEWALDQIGLNRANPSRNVSQVKRFWRNLHSCLDTFRSGQHSPLYAIQAAWSLIESLHDNPEVDICREAPIEIATHCKQIIDHQIGQPPSVDELTERLKVNRSTLFRAFKKHYDLSPKQYIEEQRFEKATRLLSQSNLSVKEIAMLCGYDDQRYFSRSFSARHNVSPSVWRRRSATNTHLT